MSVRFAKENAPVSESSHGSSKTVPDANQTAPNNPTTQFYLDALINLSKQHSEQIENLENRLRLAEQRNSEEKQFKIDIENSKLTNGHTEALQQDLPPKPSKVRRSVSREPVQGGCSPRCSRLRELGRWVYRSSELSAFGYVADAHHMIEIVFWLTIVCFFLLFAGINLYGTLQDLFQENLITNQLPKQSVRDDFKQLEAWTFCMSDMYGGGTTNAPIFDAIMVADLKETNPEGSVGFQKNFSAYMDVLIDTHKQFELHKNFDIFEHYYLQSGDYSIGWVTASFYPILRKYLQWRYRLEMPQPFYRADAPVTWRERMFYEYFLDENLEFTSDTKTVTDDDSVEVSIGVLTYPNDLWMQLYEAWPRMEDELITNRREVKDKWYGWKPKGVFTESCELKLTTNLPYMDALYQIFTPTATAAQDVECIRNMTHIERINTARNLSDLYLADLIDNPKFTDSGAPFNSAKLRESVKIVRQFARMADEYTNTLNTSNERQNFMKTLVHALAYTSQPFTEFSFLNMTTNRVTTTYIHETDYELLVLDGSLECWKLRQKSGTLLTQLHVRTFRFYPEFVARKTFNDMQQFYLVGFAILQTPVSVTDAEISWRTPNNHGPAFAPKQKFEFRKNYALSVHVESQYMMQNTTHTPCVENRTYTSLFDCRRQCQNMLMMKRLNCTSNILLYDWRSRQLMTTQTLDRMKILMPCEDIDLMSSSFIEQTDSTITQAFLYYNRTDNIGTDTFFDCDSVCHPTPRCEYSVYAMYATQNTIYGEIDELSRESITESIIGFRYQTGEQYFLVEQSFAFDAFEFVAGIGGVLDLWLGIGLMSILHFMLTLFKIAMGAEATPTRDTDRS